MNTGKTILKNDIVLIAVPYINFEEKKVRPVIVLTNPNNRNDFLGAFVTSKPISNGIQIQNTRLNNLKRISFVNPNKLFSLSTERVIKKIDEISTEFEHQIKFMIFKELVL